MREGAEEVAFFKDDVRVALDRDWLVPLCDPFELESMSPDNRERSTLYGIALPHGVSALQAGDETDLGKRVRGTLDVMSLASVFAIADNAPTTIADGLSRALAAIRENLRVRERFDAFVRKG